MTDKERIDLLRESLESAMTVLKECWDWIDFQDILAPGRGNMLTMIENLDKQITKVFTPDNIEGDGNGSV